jgi:RND superfamily putative drug exporter
MVFGFVGRAVSRAWWLVLASWVVLLAAVQCAAPPWSSVVRDREFDFLPADSPSRRGEKMFAQAFPDDRLTTSNIVLVVRRTGSGGAYVEQDKKFIEDVLEPGLRQIAAAEGGLADEVRDTDEPLFTDDAKAPPPTPKRSVIARVRTPNAPGSGALLVSPDREVLLVVAELTTDFMAKHNWPTIAEVEDFVHGLRGRGELPTGMELTLTGSAVMGRDQSVAELSSARATETLTGVLVVAILVLIYRSPLLALIPLATVFLSVKLSLALLAILAGAGLVTLFQTIPIYVTILAYGAGVDYCLFLTARYREELGAGKPPAEAVAATVASQGSTLTASAFTVICGIGMMWFAEFGKFHEAGIAIPISVALVLCATLTFSPALLRLAGRWAFWPRGDMAVPGASGPSTPANPCDMIHPRGLSYGWEAVVRAVSCRPGLTWTATVAVMAPFAVAALLLHDRVSYDLIGNLPATAPSVAGTRALQQHFPAGVTGPVELMLIDPKADFHGEAGHALVARLTDRLRERREELDIADVRSLTAPLGITPAAKEALAAPRLPEDVRRQILTEAAEQRYTSDLGERKATATRLEIIFETGPFDRESARSLSRVEQAIRQELPPDTRADAAMFVAGPTASVRDLANVMQRDRVRIEVLVMVSVFVVLVLLLREFVVPVYLLLSVLFSYFVTLGVTFAVFWLFDPRGFTGIDWKVAIFLFAILIAVGEDYNIFLMTRVREERRRLGPLRGIAEAVVRTGPIISSCGIIMAGTFASLLLAATLSEMRQLGFALAFGVLLDTFVVRSLLVPSFLVLLDRSRERAAATHTTATFVKP